MPSHPNCFDQNYPIRKPRNQPWRVELEIRPLSRASRVGNNSGNQAKSCASNI